MPYQSGGSQSETADETYNVARMILVAISLQRCARLAVPSCIGHEHIEIALEETGYGSPAGTVTR